MSRDRRPGRDPRRRTERMLVALVVVGALASVGAARAPAAAAAPGELCIPVLLPCATPSPTPSPTDDGSAGGSDGSGGGLGGILLPPAGLGDVLGTPPGALPVPPLVAQPDPEAPVMTLPAAQLGGSSLTIGGLRSVSVVSVPLADGSRAAVLKIMADDIAIDDFQLDVRHEAGGDAAVTDSGRMELTGDVRVYLDSATATLLDGTGLTIGAATPPPGGELPSQLLRVNLGLVGVTADRISLIPSHLSLR